MAIHSVFLKAWRMHGQRSLEGYSPRAAKRVGHEFNNGTATTVIRGRKSLNKNINLLIIYSLDLG